MMTTATEISPLIVSNQNGTSQMKITDQEGFPTLANLVKKGVVIPVVGSTARDHLANERTFLAWTRTGLALIGAGLGLLKWDAEGSDAEGYLVAFMGILCLVMATYRYFHNMQLLAAGFFEPNVHGILMVVTVVVATIATAFAMQFHKRNHS